MRNFALQGQRLPLLARITKYLMRYEMNMNLDPDTHLEVFVDQHYRPFVSMSSENKVVAN